MDWEVKRLIDTSSNEKYSFTGGPFGSDLKENCYTDNGVRIIQLQNISDGKFLEDYKIFTSEEKADQLKSCNIYPGDIIIAKMADPVARACIIPDIDKRYLMASDGIRLSISKKDYDANFVLYAINSTYFRKNAERHSTGTTRLRIGLTELRNLPIGLPQLKEQRRIAEILTTVDDAIEKTSQIIDKIKKLKKGLMQRLLTHGIGHKKYKETEIGEIPVDWAVVKLGKVADLKNGINFKKEQKGNKGILTIDVLNMYSTSIFIDPTNLYRIDIDQKNKEDYLLKDKDILFVRSSVKREGVGWASLFKFFNEQVTFCGFIIRARLVTTKIHPEFLIHFLRSDAVRGRLISVSGQAAITNISQDALQGVHIVIPSENEQKKIVKILSSVDNKIEKESNHRNQLNSLKKGLMQVLLTGKLRVMV